jgi:hypothetical protein
VCSSDLNAYYSYDVFAEERAIMVDDAWGYFHERAELSVGRWHYVIDDAKVTELPFCDKCDKTCITMNGYHINVPEFGRCAFHIWRRGKRTLFAMAGPAGTHFQIHEDGKLVSFWTDGYPTDGDIMFTGDVVSFHSGITWTTFSRGAALPETPS